MRSWIQSNIPQLVKAKLPPLIICSEETHKHLGSLLEYLKEYAKPGITPALEKLRQPVPFVAFNDLWLLFEPGDEIYWNLHTEHLSNITLAADFMTATLKRPEHDDEMKEPSSFEIIHWSLASD